MIIIILLNPCGWPPSEGIQSFKSLKRKRGERENTIKIKKYRKTEKHSGAMQIQSRTGQL